MFRRDECHSRTRHGVHCEIDREEARNGLCVLFTPRHLNLHVTMETDARARCRLLPDIRIVGLVRFDLAGAS